MGVLANGFGNGMGAGFCEMVCQQSGVVGKWIEFRNGKVSFRERPGLVKQDCGGILCVLNRLDRLVGAKGNVSVSEEKKN